MMEKDPKIVAISAAMLEGTGLIEVKKKFPDRVYDVGIAEEHAVIMAGGMAKAGLKPVVAIYSTFLQRSFDQLIHDVALRSLPVTVCIDRAGLVGDDGKTHQGIFDVAYTRDDPEHDGRRARRTRTSCSTSSTRRSTPAVPTSVRYPRGMALGVELEPTLQTVPHGKGEILREGRDLTLLRVRLDGRRSRCRRPTSSRSAASRAASPTPASPSRSTWTCSRRSRDRARGS